MLVGTSILRDFLKRFVFGATRSIIGEYFPFISFNMVEQMFTEILSPLICVFLAHYLVPNIQKEICVSASYSV